MLEVTATSEPDVFPVIIMTAYRFGYCLFDQRISISMQVAYYYYNFIVQSGPRNGLRFGVAASERSYAMSHGVTGMVGAHHFCSVLVESCGKA